jgi:hypothetical protein
VKKRIPHPLRLIVATCGTYLLILIKRLDHTLQQLNSYIDTYIKDSSDFLHYAKAFEKLQINRRMPTNNIHSTVDTASMYTYIGNDHIFEVLK